MRPATLCDRERLLGWIAEYYAHDGMRFDRGRADEGVETLLRDPSLGRLWILGQDEGYVLLTFGFDLESGGKEGWLVDIYLVPSARRKGIGTSALRAIFGEGRKLGLRAVHLQVARDNEEARAFYASMGFVAYDRIPMTFSL